MVISEKCYHQDQSWYYTAVLDQNGHKFRIEIRRNAYDDQSYAKISRWEGSQWQRVHDKPIMDCHCHRISYVQEGVTIEDFSVDANVLLKVAIAIVDG